MMVFKESDTPGGEHFIAVFDQGAEPIAYADSRLNPDKTITLNSIRVDPDYRRCGVATTMLMMLAEYGKEHGADLMRGELKPDEGCETTAERFYQSRGFTIEGDQLYWPLEQTR